MFCEKCGTKCKEGAKFCSACGAPVVSEMTTEDEAFSSAGLEHNAASSIRGWIQQNKKIAWTILIVIIAVVAVIIAVCVVRHSSKDADLSVEERLELGERYYENGDYEEAVEELTAVLDVEQNMQAYRYLAASYLGLAQTESVDGETNGNTYMDLAGEVYEEAIAYALDIYEETEELPAYTEEVYEDILDYNTLTGNSVQGASDLGSKVLPAYVVGEDEGEGEGEGEGKGEGKDGDETVQRTDSSTTEENPPSTEEALALLNLFPLMADELLGEWYSGVGEIWDGEITSADEVYDIAAFASIESGIYTEPFYTSEDGIGVEGHTYSVLPTDVYKEYLRNMFGEEYSISDFVENTGFVVKDSAGTFYVPVGDFDAEEVEISIEGISDKQNENGSYDVLAKYSVYYPNDNIVAEYMLYQMKPDASSDYGYVITNMIAAGYGELDEEYQSLEDNSDESDVIEVPSEYLCSYSSDRLITDADLAAVKASDYGSLPAGRSLEQMIINEIYARHGYHFTTSEIQAYFDGKSWYQDIGSYESDMSVIESRLSSIEKQNVDYLSDLLE